LPMKVLKESSLCIRLGLQKSKLFAKVMPEERSCTFCVIVLANHDACVTAVVV
jgi:hypothetical protein